MTYTHDSSRITTTFYPNIEDYWQLYEDELLPDKFLEKAREWDQAFPTTFSAIFPEIQAPDWKFPWEVFIRPNDMAQFVAPNSNTIFVTEGLKKEDFACRMVKQGFWVNSFDLRYGRQWTAQTVARRTKQVHDSIKLRKEYCEMQCAQGTNWNGQLNSRMRAANALSWQNLNSTPLGDVLRMQLEVYRMSQKRPSYLFLGFLDWNSLHNHPAILNQLIYTDPSLLTNGMLSTLKTLQIKVVEGYYKEASTETNLHGSPGRGDLQESIVNEDKRWFMEDVALITTSQVGYLARIKSENKSMAAISWMDKDRDQILYKIMDAFTPLIEDYGRIGRIDFVDDAEDVDLYETQGAEGFWGD